ncbi:MAG: hypothetical protein WBE95_16500, partial [Trebonia sp.]
MAAVTGRLRKMLPDTQLGVIAQLHKRAEDEIARRRTPLGAVTPLRVAILLGVLLLFGGSTFIALLSGNAADAAVWVVLFV